MGNPLHHSALWVGLFFCLRMNEFHVMAIGLQSNAEFGNRWKGIMRLLEMCKNSMELFFC